MDERGDRRRAFHGVGKPHVERHLRTLAHRADKEADADRRHYRPLRIAEQIDGRSGNYGSCAEDCRVVERAGIGDDEADAEHKAEIADAIREKRFQIGVDGGRPLVPESDQQVRNQPHRFPAEEELQEIVRHHQHEHAEGEERDVGKEAGVTRVVGHVADGVDVHHQRYEAHDGDHQRRQRVDQETDRELHAARGHPGVDIAVEVVTCEHVTQHPG